jgi:hypothetical protein
MLDGRLVFTYAHVFFMGSVLVLIISDRAFRTGLWASPLRDPAAAMIVAFLAYYALRAVLYPVHDVSADHVRSLIVRVITGFLMGYVAFSAFVSKRPLGFDRQSQSVGCGANWHRQMDLAALIVYVITLTVSLYILVPWVRGDLFLLNVPTSRLIYQQFEVYLVLSQVCALGILTHRFDPRRIVDPLRGAAFIVVVVAISLATFFLAQMSGSNKGAILAAAIGGGLALYVVISAAWSRRGAAASSMLAVGVLAAIGSAIVVVDIPPMRLFGFKPLIVRHEGILVSPSGEALDGSGPSRSGWGSTERRRGGPLLPDTEADTLEFPSIAGSSLDSRGEILRDTGLQQLTYAPLFGDLGVEYVFNQPGRYIHSLISVQSHLGMIGSILMFGFLFLRSVALYRYSENISLKIAAIAILFTAFVGTFFTWQVLWFLIGGMYTLGGAKKLKA